MRKPGLLFLLMAVIAGTIGYTHANAAQAKNTNQFEISGVKGPRAYLMNTIAALKKGDIATAKADFEEYDSAWNGVEVYINTRSKDLYGAIEQNWQSKISKELNGANPDAAAIAADAQMMLAKYDEALVLVEKGPALNQHFDDVARLRMVRANLREVTPSLKAGDIAKARKSFSAFSGKLGSVQGLIKSQSGDTYTDIEKGTADIKQALKPDKPDVEQVTKLLSGVMDKYNSVVTKVTQEARAAN
jgi:hypothetical protein